MNKKLTKEEIIKIAEIPNKVKQGKSSRAKGKAFERKTREFLTSQGWIVNRFDNNVEFSGQIGFMQGKLTPSKAKFNPFTKSVMNMSSGFPDYLCVRSWKNDCRNIKSVEDFKKKCNCIYEKEFTEKLLFGNTYDFNVILVECKTNNKLDKIEKEKCEWIETNLNIPCYIAYPEKIGRRVNVKLRRTKQ